MRKNDDHGLKEYDHGLTRINTDYNDNKAGSILPAFFVQISVNMYKINLTTYMLIGDCIFREIREICD